LHPKQVIEAYRWQRALGNTVVELPHGRIVLNPAHPDVWDANHLDSVKAERPQEVEELLESMERHLAHTPWRVVHTDPFTPESFTARLALDGYVEQPAVIQMVLHGPLEAPAAGSIVPVRTEADWATLAALVRRDHEEGARTGGHLLSPELSASVVAAYRAKDGPYRFHLVHLDGQPVAYGALAVAPSGAGMIEDLFTLPAFRRRGIASALIAYFAADLAARQCSCVFLGAIVGEKPRHLYAKLGFRPLMLTRCWVRRV
jgi:GNAT superfamily N-acetyltransferase